MIFSEATQQIQNHAVLDATCARLDGATIRIYGGESPPSTGPTNAIVLAQLQLPIVAFKPVVMSSRRSNAIAPALALASGRPSWFQAIRDGEVVSAGTCGVDGELKLDREIVNKGDEIVPGEFVLLIEAKEE